MTTTCIVLQHRSIHPPLFIGEDCLAQTVDDAKTFRSFTEAEVHLSDIGISTLLYTPTEVSAVTVSKNIRKTTRWKDVARDAELVAAMHRNLSSKALDEARVLRDELADSQSVCEGYRKAHRKALEGLVAVVVLWVATTSALVWVLS